MSSSAIEFIQALTVIWCTVTYWLGGQEIPWTGKGYLWIRRILMPIGLAIGLIALGCIEWKAILACFLLALATHYGYESYVWKFFVAGALMAAPSLIIAYYWTVFLPPLVFGISGAINQKDSKFNWVYVELLVGMSIGIAYVTALSASQS